jgi:hypothetical protein
MEAFSSGLAYGAEAAVLSFLVYTKILIVTGIELGTISIAVSYVIGMAVRKGSNGWGGRRNQIAAVLLTYFSISFSSVAMIWWALGGASMPLLTLLRFR